MPEEFISFNDINSHKINSDFISDQEVNNLEGNEKFVYQIQAVENSNYAKIMKVLLLKELHDILIKEFDLSLKFKCFMISIIYDEDLLNQYEDSCKFHLVRINICYNDGVKLSPIGWICYNFHTFDHKKEKKNIKAYLSSYDNIIELKGYFSITFHFKENDIAKFITMETFKEYCGQINMMNNLIKYLSGEKIQNILNKLT